MRRGGKAQVLSEAMKFQSPFLVSLFTYAFKEGLLPLKNSLWYAIKVHSPYPSSGFAIGSVIKLHVAETFRVLASFRRFSRSSEVA